MKLGFRTAGYRDWSLPDAFGSIAGAGFDGVEVCLEHKEARPEELSARRAEQIAAEARAAGLEVASVSYHADNEPDGLRTRNQRRAVVLTPDFGTNILILNARTVIEGRGQQQWDEFKHNLDSLLPLAQAEGVLICLEPEPGHFLDSCADMERLLREVGHPNLKVNLDVGHAFLTDADLTAAIRALGPAIAHTHVEGMRAGIHKHLTPGHGDLDLVAAYRALEAAAYAGYYTVDLFDIAQDPETHAKVSREGLRRLWGV